MPAFPTDPFCIFCKIIAGQIPCHKIYEDEICLAFLDIGPIVVGHTLVIPKAHYANALETPPDLLADLNRRLPSLAKAVLKATGTQACHLLANNGSEASQSVQHLHYHILPRHQGDGYKLPWPSTPLDPTTAGKLVAAITAGLTHPAP